MTAVISIKNIINVKTALKALCCVVLFAAMFFASTLKSSASDYQYKILDPKYNPQAEEILEGKTPVATEIKLPADKKPFDFGVLFSICALIAFPAGVIFLVIKLHQKLFDDVVGRDNQVIGNIKIERKKVDKKATEDDKKLYTTNDDTPVVNNSSKTAQDSSQSVQKSIKDNVEKIKMPAPRISPESKLPQGAGNSINKYFSSPINKAKNPMLLNTSVLTSNKGICLVEYNKKYSLIGYIDNDIFVLNQFDAINGTEIRARLSETVAGKDRYIVRLGRFKGLVEVSEENMKLLIEL